MIKTKDIYALYTILEDGYESQRFIDYIGDMIRVIYLIKFMY